MVCRESGGKTMLLCFGLFLVASSFCHCTILTKLKALGKLRGNLRLDQGKAKASDLRHGKLVIGHNSQQGAKFKGRKHTKNLLDVASDYQADMGWGEPMLPKRWDDSSKLKPENAAVERLLKMEPKVECTGDSMKLQVQNVASTPGSLFFVDRGSHLSPLPLSKLPPSCGYTIRSTQRDLVFIAPYDGCFVTLVEDSYVLPLRWSGLPVRMSCPLRQSSPNPPMVTCHPEGMVVKMEWTVPVAKIEVNLIGDWEPLMKASPRCGFSVVVHPEGVVIAVSYAPCLERKDGMYTFELAGDGEIKISCPSLYPVQPEPTKRPEQGSKRQTETLSKVVQSQPVSPAKQTEVPQPFPPLAFYPWAAQPEVPVQIKPTVQPSDRVTQLSYPNIFYVNQPNPDGILPTHRPELMLSTAPPLVKNTKGQRWQPFFPFPFYPQPLEPDIPPTEPPGKLEEHFLPNPLSGPPQKPVAPKTPVSEDPRGHVYQPFYPYPFYAPFAPNIPYQMPLPTNQQTPTPPPKGHVQQPLNPSHPETLKPKAPENVSPSKPPAPERYEPPQPEAPQGKVHQPFYPYPFYSQPEPEKPTAVPKLPAVKPPEGQLHHSFNPYYIPQQPWPVMLTPTTSVPKQVNTPGDQTPLELQPNGGIVPQDPPLGSPYVPPVSCPTFCLSGFSNCCPSVAFHQHLHIVPAGLGSENTPPVYSGLPFLPSVAYYGFGNGLSSYPLSQKPTEAKLMQAATPAPISPQSLPSGNEKQPHLQPPDGNSAALTRTNPSKPTHPEKQIYPYLVPNSLYPNWPYRPQNELQNLSPTPYTVPSKLESPHPQSQSELDDLLVPYHMLQDVLTPTYDNLSQPQPFVSDSKKFTKYEQTLHSYPEPKHYVLLQQGPPGKEPVGFNKSPLPFRDVVHDANVLAQNVARHQHPQNLKPPDAPVGPRFVPLPQDPSLSAAHLKPKFPESFQDFWKPMTPLGSSQRIPTFVSGNAFQQWHSAKTKS